MKTLLLLLLPLTLSAQTETAFTLTRIAPVSVSPDNQPPYLINPVTLTNERNAGDSVTFALNRLNKVILTQHGPQKPMPATMDSEWTVDTVDFCGENLIVWEIKALPYNLRYITDAKGNALALRSMDARTGLELVLYSVSKKKKR